MRRSRAVGVMKRHRARVLRSTVRGPELRGRTRAQARARAVRPTNVTYATMS
jgi:hypothetical protein